MTDAVSRSTILVVDDEAPLLRLISRVLEKQGHHTLTACDGTEAIELFDKHCDEIDAAVLDVVIPPNGIGEVLDHMIAARDDLALILSSGDMLDPEIFSRIESQGGVFLRKPFLPRVLLDLVDRGLEAKSAGGP